jgi:hypothetical protein
MVGVIAVSVLVLCVVRRRPSAVVLMITSRLTLTRRRVRYPESAVLSALSARPLARRASRREGCLPAQRRRTLGS